MIKCFFFCGSKWVYASCQQALGNMFHQDFSEHFIVGIPTPKSMSDKNIWFIEGDCKFI